MTSGEEEANPRRRSVEHVRSFDAETIAVQQEAAQWALRLAAADADEAAVDWSALTVWLERQSEARSALGAAEAALEVLHAHRRELRREMRSGRSSKRERARRNRWMGGLTGSGLAVAAITAWLTVATRAPAPQVWKAPEHAVLSVVLSDGSKVTLDRSARLEFRPTRTGRAARLSRGSQALFDVVRDPARPFRIDVGAAQVRVLGTLFGVNDTPGGLGVMVGRGAVAVADRPGARVVRVGAGESFSRDAVGQVHLTRIAVADVGAWRSGVLTYVDAPVATLAHDLSRYWARPVTLGTGVGRLRFTGALVIDTPLIMAKRLHRLSPINVRETEAGFVLQASDGDR